MTRRGTVIRWSDGEEPRFVFVAQGRADRPLRLTRAAPYSGVNEQTLAIDIRRYENRDVVVTGIDTGLAWIYEATIELDHHVAAM